MKQIDKIVKGIVEPKDINVLWLDTNDSKSPILKAYADGEWKAISSGEGGGGSAEGAVSYNEQTLTDEQKMQARINQGLYAEGPGLSIEWDGDTTGKDVFRGEYYRVADYVYIEDGASLVGTGEFKGETFTEELVAIDRSESAGVAKGTIIELTASEGDFVVAISFNNFSFNGVTLDGLYFQEFTRKIEVPGEVYNKIPARCVDITIPEPETPTIEPVIVEFEYKNGQYKRVYDGPQFNDVAEQYLKGTPIIGKCTVADGSSNIILYTKNVKLADYSADSSINMIQFYFEKSFRYANLKFGADTYIDNALVKPILYIEWNSGGTFFDSWQLVPYDSTLNRSPHNAT